MTRLDIAQSTLLSCPNVNDAVRWEIPKLDYNGGAKQLKMGALPKALFE